LVVKVAADRADEARQVIEEGVRSPLPEDAETAEFSATADPEELP
jgi:hypothetical protein